MEGATKLELDAQYRALREEAAWVERRAAILVVRGPDAVDYLHSQLTNDIEALAPGEGCYSCLLDRKGHMQGDMRVLRRSGDELVVVLEPEAHEAVSRHLGMYKIGRDVELDDIGAGHVVISVIGPAAFALCDLAPLEPEHANREERLGATSCLAVATDTGFDVLADAGARDEIVAALEDAGVEPAGEDAAEIIRVERGRPRFGREMTTKTIPQEAGINDRAISFTKGCYIGQETVARLHYKGKPNRSLRGLRLAAPATAGDAITLGEKQLGTVGTAVVSPVHGPIALAIVRREADVGTTVKVADENEAEVIDLPF